MLFEPPTNTYQWLFITLAAIPLALRSVYVYRKSQSQIAQAMAWAFSLCVLGAITLFSGFVITRDFVLLSILFTLGDFFFHAMYFWVGRILWLMAFAKHFRYRYVLVPYGILIVIAFIDAAMAYLPDGVQVVDGVFIYTGTDFVHNLLFSLVTFPFVIIGLYVLSRIKFTTSLRGKVRSASLGLMFTMIGLIYSLSVFTEELSSESVYLIGAAVGIAAIGSAVAPFFSSTGSSDQKTE